MVRQCAQPRLDERQRVARGIAASAGAIGLALLALHYRNADAASRRSNGDGGDGGGARMHRSSVDNPPQHRAELRALANHLQTVREDQCQRLAHELHDEMGALLSDSMLDLARLRRQLAAAAPESLPLLDRLRSSLDGAVAMKRRIIEDLRPSALIHLGLVPALDKLVHDFGDRAGIAVHATLDPVQLPEPAQLTVYRLVQEALTNVAKHARATAVSLQLRDHGRHCSVRIADDGQGFDSGRAQPSAHGLLGMRYRIEAAGGSLRIDAAPGRGTCLEATLPHAAPPGG